MFQAAQCCPIAMFAPIFVSMNVSAKLVVPDGTPVQFSPGITPEPNAPLFIAHVNIMLNFAPSA